MNGYVELFHLLEDRGLPVKYGDSATGVNYPCVELALDEEFHQRMLATAAKGIYVHGEETVRPIVDRLGIHL